MKVNGRGFSWFTLLLLGSCVMSVLPNNSTTFVKTFQAVTMTTGTERQSKSLTQPASIYSAKEENEIIEVVPTSQITSLSYHTNHVEQKFASNRGTHPVGRRWAKSAVAKRDAHEKPDAPHPCDVFITDEVNTNMFYSPGYPNNYPNNTDCVRVLQAPSGQILRLDFRDKFDIEPSEGCKFDFLEVRDGGFGYSNLLGKFCGRDFPPMITSKERQLWLHFHSDDNIEYSGFTAVYDFIPKPTSSLPEDLVCRIHKGGFEGFVNNTDVPENITEIIREHKIATDCMWVITVKEGWKIQLNFLQFNLKRPNECDVNFVDIFPEQTDEHSKLKNFCGSAADSINSLTNVLHVRYYAEYVAYNSSFTILYTAFRDKGAACEDGEYDCEDATCISAELRCNGRNNCRFRWDEDECKGEDDGQSEHVIIIIVVFGLILGGMMITFCVNCIRKLLRDQKIIRIQLNFLQFNLKRPNECDVNFVDIFPEQTDEHSKLKNFCGSAADSINSLTNVLHVRYYAEYVAYNSSFTILYTAFRDKGAACEDGEYDCEDATCISAELRCNGRNNCRFRWDEDECKGEDDGQSEHVIIIIVVFGLILGGMMITFCVNCIRKLLRDQKIIREHIRQSKESKLDEMGRASAKRSRENLSKITQLTPNSLQILDDVSNRYYREAIPIPVQNSRSESKSDTLLRQHHDMVVQTSLGDDTPTLDQGGTCEMGCQTRESLFQPVQRQQKSSTTSPHQSGLRFSTFGYDTPPTSTSQSAKSQKYSKEKSSTAPTTIELEDLSHTEIPTKPYEVCHHHHQHQQHLQQLQKQAQSVGKGGKQKMEESRSFIDIRNSAPDVIIMTSH